jgi:PRTRC genetic system protein C
MDIKALIREFSYNSVKLADPNPTFTLVQVRDFYATTYPEIISADIEGPKNVGAKSIYSFRRAVGTKGGADEFTWYDLCVLEQMAAARLVTLEREIVEMNAYAEPPSADWVALTSKGLHEAQLVKAKLNKMVSGHLAAGERPASAVYSIQKINPASCGLAK